MGILLRWLTNAITIVVAAYFLPGIHVADFVTALAVALVLGILNAVVKPILFILTLPFTILTFGLFIFILNAFLVMLTAHFIHGFHVDSFVWAVVFSVILSLVNAIASKIFR